ncbi:MAG: TolC family protein [Vampirovibrionia bacterium]
MKRRLSVYLCILFYLHFNAPIYSESIEQEESLKINLAQSVDIALNNNLMLQRQAESNNIFKLRAQKSVTYLLPNFVAGSEYAYNSSIKVITVPNTPMELPTSKKNVLNTNVSFVQPITDLYKNSLKYKIAKEKFNISLLDSDLKKEFVIDLVSQSYFNLIRQKKIIELNKQNINTLEAYHKIAKDHYDAGIALARDYMKVQIEIDNARHRLFKEENRLNILNSQFKELLGVDLDDNVEITGEYTDNNIENSNLNELQDVALNNRSELKQLNKAIHIAKLNKKVEISEYIPHVNFFVSYANQVGSEFMPDNNILFGVNAQYDFWQWNRKYLSVKEQNSEIKTKELELKEQKRSIKIEVESQLNSVLESKDLIDVSKHTVNLSEENVRITNDRYNIGLALITDLLDDQTALLEAQVKLITSELEYQKSLIELNKVLGIL